MAAAEDPGPDPIESTPHRTWIVVLSAVVLLAAVTTAFWTIGGVSDTEVTRALPGESRSDLDGERQGEEPIDTTVAETMPIDTTVAETMPIDTTVAETMPIDTTFGVYPGFGDDESLRELEEILGRGLGSVVQFGDQRNADELVFSSQGALSRLAEWINDRDPIYSLTIPLGFGDADARSDEGRAGILSNLAETAAGAHDDQYRLVAARLISGGVPDAVLRIGHEFDGDWYPWSARVSCEAYVEAFRHVAEVFRRESEAFRMEWTATLRNFEDYGSCAYPGDDVVDIVGLDVYDRGGPVDRADGLGWLDPPKVWDEQFQPRLENHLAFAINRGKPVSYPEWGLYLGTESGAAGGDNPYFVDAMADWFESLPRTGGGSLAYQAYFIGVEDHDIRKAPNSLQVLLDRFGAS